MGKGTYKVQGQDHEFDHISGSCIWCGEHVDFGDDTDCNKHTKKSSKSASKSATRSTIFRCKKVSKSVIPTAGKQLWEASGKSKGHGKSKPMGACRDTHPILKIANAKFLGGSCSNPRKDSAEFDVFIGFDKSMSFTYRSFPWKQGDEFLYYIPDMTAPKDPVAFQKMIVWVAKQMEAGRNVHAGCIGGHGRTGTFLAALWHTVTGDKEAGKWVRENYCERAIESTTQIEFLKKNYGIEPVKPSKSGYSGGSSKTPSWSGTGVSTSGMKKLSNAERLITPIQCKCSIWGNDEDDELELIDTASTLWSN